MSALSSPGESLEPDDLGSPSSRSSKSPSGKARSAKAAPRAKAESASAKSKSAPAAKAKSAPATKSKSAPATSESSAGEKTETRQPDRRPQQLAQVPFVGVLVAILAVGMVGLLLLNTKIQTQADQLKALNDEAEALSYQQAALTADVERLRSTSSLERRAYALGMRPNPHPAFVVLPDGTVLGTPQKVTGKELPNQYYSSWEEQIAMQKAAAEQAARKKAEAAKRAEAAKKAEAARKAEAAKKAQATASTQPSAAPKPSASPQPGNPQPSGPKPTPTQGG